MNDMNIKIANKKEVQSWLRLADKIGTSDALAFCLCALSVVTVRAREQQDDDIEALLNMQWEDVDLDREVFFKDGLRQEPIALSKGAVTELEKLSRNDAFAFPGVRDRWEAVYGEIVNAVAESGV